MRWATLADVQASTLELAMRASTLLGFKTPLAQRPCYRSTSEKLRTNYQRSLRAGCSLNALNKGSTRWEGRSRERSTSCEKNGDSTKGLVVLQVCLGTVCRFLAHLGSRDKRIYFLLLSKFLTAICALFSTNLTQARVGKSRLQQDLQQLKTSGDSTVEDREHPLPLHVELIERALATG